MRIDKINKIYWLLVILMAVITLVLGYIGWGGEDKLLDQDGMTEDVLQWEIITRILLLFIGEGQNLEFSNDNWALWVARLSALLCVLGAAIRVIIHLAIGRLDRWYISKMRGHVIICGMNDVGRAFVLSEQKNGRNVVVISREISSEDEIFLKLHDASSIVGDCREEGLLKSVAIRNVHCVILVTGEDTMNFEALNAIRSVLKDDPKAKGHIPIYLEVAESAFWQKTTQTDLIVPAESHTIARPFNRHYLVARDFIWHYPLYNYAELLGQDRIHCAFWGYDEHVEALIERIATSCIYKSFGKIKISILAYGIEQVEHLCLSRFRELQNIVDFSFYQFDWQREVLDQNYWDEMVADCPITACFYTGGSDRNRLQKAISLKDSMVRLGRDTAPHFIQLERTSGLENLLISPEDTNSLGDVFCPFGSITQVCSLEIIGEKLEETARRLHEKYQTFNAENLTVHEQQTKHESALTWAGLAETLKASNRRAIDHLPAKLASVGCLRPAGLELLVHPSFSMGIDDVDQLNRVSKLEQQSWSAGRYVDGWRSGNKRDNKRKVHNMLGKTYEELDEQTKDYDRDQVTLIDKTVLDRSQDKGVLGRFDHWIGFIGHNKISKDEAIWIKKAMVEKVLPELLDKNTGHHFTILSPLAPGSDALLTSIAIGFFKENNVPYRLLVTDAVPEDEMLTDFETSYRERGELGFPIDGDQPWFDRHSKIDGQRSLAKARQQLITEECDWLVSLRNYDDDFISMHDREIGYDKAATYINQKAHTLVAVCRNQSEAKVGGTAASLITRKDNLLDSDLIWWAGGDKKTITLDPTHEQVHEDVF